MSSLEVRVPDIGDVEEAEVVEILVSAGDRVEAEDVLLSIESDKATLEIPAPQAGSVESVAVKVGDTVAEGSVLATLRVERDSAAEGAEGREAPAAPAPDREARPAPEERTAAREAGPAASEQTPSEPARQPGEAPRTRPPDTGPAPPREPVPHASPLVRRQARELGVDLREASGSGPQGRILEEDVKAHVREAMRERGGGLPAPPALDPARVGELEQVALSRTRRASVRHLSRSWPNVPQVTHFEDADVTRLEAFRRASADRAGEHGVELGLLPFVLRACVGALEAFPALRSSLAADAEHVFVRRELHLGVTVQTDDGVVVPVLRDADARGVLELAAGVADLTRRARQHRLAPEELEGAVFSVVALEEGGGTGFTPLVHAPEAAILGMAARQRRPVWDDEASAFVPRDVLPLSLSYDHRVVSGGEAAAFTAALCRRLSSPAALLL